MASDPDDFDQNIENLKAAVKQSFARIYAAVEARELKTLRQLDALRCQNEKRNCIQNIHLSYDNESTLLENVRNYGLIDLEKLIFDNSTFTLEDVSPDDDDHMFPYKTIEDLAHERTERFRTEAENCMYFLNVGPQETSKQFRNVIIETESKESAREENNEATEDEKSDSSDPEVVKINPTDDWLNSIKSQTETEPSQVSGVMEHNLLLNNMK